MRPDGVLEMRCSPSPFETLARALASLSRCRSSGRGRTLNQALQAYGLDFAQASPPLIPAHSASKTRVNALMAGIQSIIENLGPRLRGDERRVQESFPHAARARALRRRVGGRRRARAAGGGAHDLPR